MLQKRIILTFIILIVLLGGIIVAIQLNSRNQTPQPVDLKDVAMISATDGWAIGETKQHNPEILHYDGKQWAATNDLLPDQKMSLSSIGMVSPTEGWIVGGTSLPLSNGSSQSTSVGIILHYSKGSWSIVNGTIVPPVLRGLFIISADDIWTVGDEGSILHYDGVQWNEITSPVIANTLSLTDVAATSHNNIWVTGSLGVLLHYDGATWKRIAASIFDAGADSTNFLSIAMSSPADGWIVGHRAHSPKGLILHYQNGEWQEIQNSPNNNLQSVLMISTTDSWAVGEAGTVMHYSNHQWTQVTKNIPAVPGILLCGLSFISSHDGWVVGDQGALLHYYNGTWKASIETSSS